MKRLVAIAGALAGLVLLAVPGAVLSDPDPDGLQRVAADRGFAQAESDHALADGPLAGYRLRVAGNEQGGRTAAAAIGILATFGAATWLTLWLRRSGGNE